MPEDRPANNPKITRVEIDRELCIGAASCVTVTPEAFRLDSENKSTVIPGHRADDEAVLSAARACPVAAIYLYGQDGRRIYPPPA